MYAVPITGGWAVCLASRVGSRADMVGYCFGPRREELPVVDSLAPLKPERACHVGIMTELGIDRGEWMDMGALPDWDRSEWATPIFYHHDSLTKRYWEVTYDDDDPGRMPQRRQLPSGTRVEGPEDGLQGHGFVEERLSRMLGS